MKTRNDIPNKFPPIYYHVGISLNYLQRWVDDQLQSSGFGDDCLDMNPDFQRGHVWTEQQQIDYLEFRVRGGSSGKDLYFNCPDWKQGKSTDFVLVDGLQRLTAGLRFVQGEIPIFGGLIHEWGKAELSPSSPFFGVNIACMKTKKEVMQWYINMNSGGTPHPESEIERVKRMIANA